MTTTSYMYYHYCYFISLLALTLDYLFNSLGDNDINSKGATALGDALKVNRILKALR